MGNGTVSFFKKFSDIWPKFAQKWVNPNSRISTLKIGRNSAKKGRISTVFLAKFSHFGGISIIFMGEYSTVRIRPKWQKKNNYCVKSVKWS
jgi:hypothetical protein